MLRYKTTMLGTFIISSLATAVFAQDSSTTTVPAETMTAPMDCEAQFATLDTDGNGVLSDAEAPREYARLRVDETAVQDTGINKDDFLKLCASDHWAQNVPEDGAPFEGANSFTEEQARDRAIAWNVKEVSALVLDDKGVWRGNGKLNGAEVSVAVDFKGNVVTTPKS